MSDNNKTSCVFFGPCPFFSGDRLKINDKAFFVQYCFKGTLLFLVTTML